MKTERSTLLVVGVAAIVLVGTAGLVVGFPGLDGGEAATDNPADTDSTDGADSGDDDGDADGDGRDTDGDDDTADQDDGDSVEFDGEEPLELDPADGTVAGTADVEAGTELAIQLTTVPGEESAFFLSKAATAGEDGAFEVAFDFSDVSVDAETEAEVVVRTAEDSERLGNATVTFTDASTNTGSDEGTDSDTVEFDGEQPLELDPADPAISGTADVEADTVIQVSLVSKSGEDAAFFIQAETTADEDGAFEAAIDFTTVPEAGTEAEVTVRTEDGSEVLGVADVVITEPSEEIEEPPTTAELVDIDGTEPFELGSGETTLSGTAENLSAGEELNVIVLPGPEEDSSALPVEASPTVDENGEFAVDLNLSEVEHGTAVEVVLEHPEARESLSLDGVVVDSDA